MPDKLPAGMALYRRYHKHYGRLEVIAPSLEVAHQHYLEFKHRWARPSPFLSIGRVHCDYPPNPELFKPPCKDDWEIIPLPAGGVSWFAHEEQEVDELYGPLGELVC